MINGAKSRIKQIKQVALKRKWTGVNVGGLL